jgi:TatD DNase family protein
MLIDSHCHLNMLKLDAYHGDLTALIQQARSVGVEHILCVATDLDNAKQVIEIAERYDDVSASVGVHPSDVADHQADIDELLRLAAHPKVIAIGETGLDYHYNDAGLDGMRQQFRDHIKVARELNKPLIIHSRDAREDTMRILDEEGAKSVAGVMHCFTESWEMAQQAMALGFYISISGIVTFKNAKEVAEVAKKVPLDRLLIETDAPFLAPVPYRGKQNEPQYVRFVAEKIAELRHIHVDDVAKATTENFKRLFF